MDNFFDPSPESPFTPSENLPENDPLRDWASQLQDPELHKLMATDPKAAVEKMKEMGVPPPPPQIMQYTDGLGPENGIPGIRRGSAQPGTYGGATPSEPYPAGSDPMTAGTPPKSLFQRGADAISNLPIFNSAGKMQGNMTSAQGQVPAPSGSDGYVPTPTPDPRKMIDPGFDPKEEPEVNPRQIAGIPIPQPRPEEAPARTPTDVSSKNKTADALEGFSKSLQGVKPVAPPAPNFVGTPSVRSPGHVNAPSLQNLLGLVGQPAPSPLALTLGRLLQTGKA